MLTSLSHLASDDWAGKSMMKIQFHRVGPDLDASVRVSFAGYAPDVVKSVHLTHWSDVSVKVSPTFGDSIRSFDEPMPITLDLTVTDSEGNIRLSQTKQVTLLPVNQLAWRLQGTYSPENAAVFVTPASSFIDDVLAQAAKKTPWKAIVGYNEEPGYTHTQVVDLQMKAVWDALQARGFNYVAGYGAYNSSQPVSVRSAHETYTTGSGNCLESTNLLASIFERARLKPNVIFRPDHSYLSVDVWSDNRTSIPLETTMLGWASYSAAWNEGMDKFQEDQGKWGTDGYAKISIGKARADGITPTPWMT